MVGPLLSHFSAFIYSCFFFISCGSINCEARLVYYLMSSRLKQRLCDERKGNNRPVNIPADSRHVP
jgi:hypothetical protein